MRREGCAVPRGFTSACRTSLNAGMKRLCISSFPQLDKVASFGVCAVRIERMYGMKKRQMTSRHRPSKGDIQKKFSFVLRVKRAW